MKIVWGARRSGKTMELIKHSSNAGAVIITRNNDTKKEILDSCKRLGISIPDPLTIYEIMDGKHYLLSEEQHFIIDDIDRFLFYILHREIDMVSFNRVDQVIHKVPPHITPDWKIEP